MGAVRLISSPATLHGNGPAAELDGLAQLRDGRSDAEINRNAALASSRGSSMVQSGRKLHLRGDVQQLAKAITLVQEGARRAGLTARRRDALESAAREG